jgi:hypothetical protein
MLDPQIRIVSFYFCNVSAMDDQGQQDPAQAGGQAQDQGAINDQTTNNNAQGGGQAQDQGQQAVAAQAPAVPTPPPAQGGQQGDGQQTGQAAGGQAQAAQPAGDQAAATQAKGEENFLRPRPPDTELGIGAVGDFNTSVAVPAHPNTTFDESYFLKMLSGSISLTKNEKKKIVESIPKLSQFQIDELIKIFEEERRKFSELDEKHQVKIRELQAKQTEDWKDLEMSEQQEGRKEEDNAAAEALKAQLMGGGAAPAAVAAACPNCQGALDANGSCPTCSASQA